MFWSALPALMLHQFEEYVFPGGFLSWFNREIFQSERDNFPFSAKAALLVNIFLGWTGYALVGYIGLKQMWFVMPMMGFLFVNAWFHIVHSVSSTRYSPGTFTAVLVLLPLSSYTFYYYVMTWEIGFRLLFMSLLAGVVAHLLMVTIPRELLHARAKRLERQAQSSQQDTEPTS